MQDIASKTIFFDQDGDLRLLVGCEVDPANGQRDFVVCSRTLARATSVFKTMLYGAYKEGKNATDPAKEWLVELPDDGPAPFKILLHIIHAQFDHVPQTIALGPLYDLLVVSQKYDMTHLLRPWVRSWSEPLAQLAKLPGHERLLWIAWELGADQIFANMAINMIMECQVDSEGHLLDSEGMKLDDYHYWPPAILELITRIRLRTIGKIIQLLKDCVYPLKISTHGHRSCSNPYSTGYQCDAMTLGCIIQSLSQLELQFLWIEDGENTYQKSLKYLQNTINGILVVEYDYTHRPCNPVPALETRVNDMISKIETPVKAEHTLYLSKQREKTGL